MRKTISVNFEYEMTEVDAGTLSVEADLEFVHEEYGADADGNRGVYLWSFEDTKELSIRHPVLKDVTKIVEKEYEEDFYRIVEEAIRIAEDEL